MERTMPSTDHDSIVTTVRDLEAEAEFFTDRLGFRVAAVFPADSPRMITLTGQQLWVVLEKGNHDTPARLRLPSTLYPGESSTLRSPGGTVVEFAGHSVRVDVPALHPEFVVTGGDNDSSWSRGRAGMRYRDLIPGRLQGWAIASHIHVPGEGAVPDYVHYHEIDFQLIYCHRGWARLVYEDQGEPFVMRAGDCVLQPPRIRHRVLESGEDLHVVEVSCPAEHATLADLDLELPTSKVDRARDFEGQRFCFHRSETASYSRALWPGFESRNFGFDQATAGKLRAELLRRSDEDPCADLPDHAAFQFLFVLRGSMSLSDGQHDAQQLESEASAVLPPDTRIFLRSPSPDLEFLLVSAPAGDTKRPPA